VRDVQVPRSAFDSAPWPEKVEMVGARIEMLEDEVLILRSGMLLKVEKSVVNYLPRSSQLPNIRAKPAP